MYKFDFIQKYGRNGRMILKTGIISGIIIVISMLVICERSSCTRLPQRSRLTKSEKLIIDTDAGGDDAGAILLILKSIEKKKNNIDVLAITCTYGNTYLNNTVINVLKTLTIANRTDIPVYKGAEKSLLFNYTSTNYFGEDGFGDFEFDREITAKVNDTVHASLAMVQLVRKYPGEVNIMTLGPLTNVALAIELDPTFVHNVRQFFIMGSSVGGHGNERPNVEYNFSADPASNFIVLSSVTKPYIIYPWETTRRTNITKEWRTEVLGKQNSEIINYLNKIERVSLAKVSFWMPADIMIAAIMISPDLIIKSLQTSMEAVYYGQATGSVLVDYEGSTGSSQNAVIVQTINVTSFKSMLMQYLD